MFAGVKQDRIGSAATVVLIHLALGYALVTGFAFDRRLIPSEPLKLIQLLDEPVPSPIEEPVAADRPDSAEEGAASPENLDARPTPLVAEDPVLPLEIEPPPIAAAPVAGTASDSDSGASDKAGPGTGAGGLGEGTGSGGSGDGRGSGAASPGRLLSGRIVHSDYPRSAVRSRAGGTVVVRLEVGPDGRVSDCDVTRSSGHPDLDSTTCRLIRQRFRYQPALDRFGRAVPSVTGWQQRWWLEREDRPLS